VKFNSIKIFASNVALAVTFASFSVSCSSSDFSGNSGAKKSPQKDNADVALAPGSKPAGATATSSDSGNALGGILSEDSVVEVQNSDQVGECSYDGFFKYVLNLQTGRWSPMQWVTNGTPDQNACQDSSYIMVPLKIKNQAGKIIDHASSSTYQWRCGARSEVGQQVPGDWSKVKGAKDLVFESNHKQGQAGSITAEIQFPNLVISCGSSNFGQRTFKIKFNLVY